MTRREPRRREEASAIRSSWYAALLSLALVLSGCVGIVEPAEVEVASVFVPSEPIVAGTDAIVSVTLANPGWRSTHGQLAVLLDGRAAATFVYDLDGRASETFDVPLRTSSLGNRTVSVRASNESAAQPAGKVTILRAGEVVVEKAVLPPTVLQGTAPAVVIAASNPGETAARASANLSAGGKRIGAAIIELAPGQSGFVAVPFDAVAPGRLALELEVGQRTYPLSTSVVNASAALAASAADVASAMRGANTRILGFDGTLAGEPVHARVGANGVAALALGDPTATWSVKVTSTEQYQTDFHADPIASEEMVEVENPRLEGLSCALASIFTIPFYAIGYGLAAAFSFGLIKPPELPDPCAGGGTHLELRTSYTQVPPMTVYRTRERVDEMSYSGPRVTYYCQGGAVKAQRGPLVHVWRQAPECVDLRVEGVDLGILDDIAAGRVAPESVTPFEDTLRAAYRADDGSAVDITVGPEGFRTLSIGGASGGLDARIAYGARGTVDAPYATSMLPARVAARTQNGNGTIAWSVTEADPKLPVAELEVRAQNGAGFAAFRLGAPAGEASGIGFEPFGLEDGTLDVGDGFVLRGAVSSLEVWDLWAGAPVVAQRAKL